MISTGAFLEEMDASSKKNSAIAKLTSAWEKKNAKAAKAGGVSLMALSLAACGSDDDTTTTSTSTDTSTTTTTTVTPVSAALTVGNDSITGTTADDTVTAGRVDTIQTWNGGDSISGGAGTDSLTAVITANVAPADGNVTGVENLTITAMTNNVTVTASTATVSGISGVTSITNVGSASNLTLTRMLDLADVTLNNTSGNTTITFNDTLLTGTSDTLTLNVNGNTGAINIGDSTGAGDAFEAVTITTSGAASTFSPANIDATATTLTLSGTALLDIDGADGFPKLATLDASGSSGGVRVAVAADTVTGTTNTKTITGGSGADILDIDQVAAGTIGALTLNAGAGNDTVVLGGQGASDYSVDGGDGVDIISIGANAAAATHAGVAGFEKLYVTAGATQNMALYTSQTNTFTHVRADAATVNFTNAPATVTDLQLTGNAATAATFARLVDGSANSLNIYATAANAATTLTVDDEETLTFDGSDGTITITNFNAEDATSITVSGDNAINLGTYAATTASLATFDASGMTAAAGATLVASASTAAMTVTGNASTAYTGSLVITTGNANDTVTGGNGADTITTGAGADTIVGGAGADIITAGEGQDTITGGGGVDIFTFTDTPTSIASSVDTITDFTVNSTNTSDDRIAIDILGGTAGLDATAIHETTTTATEVDDGDVVVLTGNNFIDTSGNAAADKTAILALGGGLTITTANTIEALAIFKADTDGDGTADEVQVWLVESTGTNTVIDNVYQLATLQGISVTSDLASDFATGDFDF